MLLRRNRVLHILFLFFSLPPLLLDGQDSCTPTAQEVVQAYVDALGGKTNLRAIETVTVTANAESLFGASSSIDVVWKSDKFLVKKIKVGAQEKQDIHQFGFDGEHQWTQDGEEQRQRKDFHASRSINELEIFGVTPYALQLLSFEGTVTQNGMEEVSGRSNWHLSFQWENGQMDHRYFDTETGLLTRVKIGSPKNASGGFGGGPPTRDFEWNDAQDNGLTTLKESRVVSEGNSDLRAQLESTTFDNEVDDALFELPDDAKQLEGGKCAPDR